MFLNNSKILKQNKQQQKEQEKKKPHPRTSDNINYHKGLSVYVNEKGHGTVTKFCGRVLLWQVQSPGFDSQH
jgi:hypothetical protein